MTDIKTKGLKLVTTGGAVLATLTVILDDAIEIKEVAVIKGKDDAKHISMPKRMINARSGGRHFIPMIELSKSLHARVENVVLDTWQEHSTPVA